MLARRWRFATPPARCPARWWKRPGQPMPDSSTACSARTFNLRLAGVGRLRIEIRGRNLPGRAFCGGEGGALLENVHVAVQERREPVGLVPGDAPAASWQVDVRVEPADGGGVDFRGPAVQGRRGERFLYLTWGDVGDDGSFAMFRRAKLMLDRIDPDLVRAAADDGRPLVADIDLTDGRGGPRCARVDPPALMWSLGA